MDGTPGPSLKVVAMHHGIAESNFGPYDVQGVDLYTYKIECTQQSGRGLAFVPVCGYMNAELP